MSEEALVYLKRIAEACERTAAHCKVIAEAHGSNGAAPAPRAATGGGDGAIADDSDLDGEWGNPTIKYDPRERYWSGPSFVGYHYSETAPDYLDAMAKYLEAVAYMSAKDADEKSQKRAKYSAKDAARARGWAARLRVRGEPNAMPAPAQGGGYLKRPGEEAAVLPEGADFGPAGADGIPF